MTQPLPVVATPSTDLSMNVLFNGAHYYVAEISDQYSGSRGFEVVNKLTGHGAFLDPEIADEERAKSLFTFFTPTLIHVYDADRDGSMPLS